MSQTLSATTPAHDADIHSTVTLLDVDYQTSECTLAKALRRILLFIFAYYMISYLDRTNVGLVALAMNKDTGLTAKQFRSGVGLFFIGYFLFEIPSGLIIQRVGACIWAARTMITQGISSMVTAFAVGLRSFAATHLPLGLAEAGFAPGIYLYLTHWLPGKWRAKVTAASLVDIPVANIIDSPLPGALLKLGGSHGLHSWQWLLLIEGLPVVLLGTACLLVLTDRPGKAKRLIDDEKAVLARRLAMEQRAIASKYGTTLRDAMTNQRVFMLAFINFYGIMGSIGVGFWMLQIVKQFGIEYTVVGWLTVIPYALDAVVMLRWVRMANRAQNRAPHMATALMVAAMALTTSTTLDAPAPKLAALRLTVNGILAFQATFQAIPSALLTDRAAAGGLALIVSIGNLGGFVGPSMVGAVKQFSQGFTVSLLVVSAVLLIGALSITWLGGPGVGAGGATTR